MSGARRTIASAEHEKLLDTIDKCRSQGVSRWIDLPQIIVCGDQSSGKSSCLEAICGLRFPTGDVLCTRFPTEYILRRSSDSGIAISVVPYSERTEPEKANLEKFKASTTDLNRFPEIIMEASKVMGIGVNGKNFAHDILRIEIRGPKQDHLTLVDLPGLFHSSSRTQSDVDKKSVFDLVGSYIKRSRSIILAVVSAKNDLNNQAVLNFARDHDPEGTRTLGIITKPDTLPTNSPSEQAYIESAENHDVKFALGWHVLRNRSYDESARKTTSEQRDLTEQLFFEDGAWKHIDQKSKGVQALRVRLSKILYEHVLGELPDLLEEVERGIRTCKARLTALGDPRGTNDEQRMYLSRASQRFVALMKAAVDGIYTDPYFGSSLSDDGYQKRLCAITMSTLKDFADTMRDVGHAIQLVDKLPIKHKHKRGSPRKVTKEDYYKEVQQRMRRNGGRELPGLYNPSIVGDLFFDQAQPWHELVQDVKSNLLEATHNAVMLALKECLDDATIDGVYRELIDPGMNELEAALVKKAEELFKPHAGGEVLTLNHQFIDNIMVKREEKARKDIGQRLFDFLGVQPKDAKPETRRYKGEFDVLHLLDILVKQSEIDMDHFATVDCVNAMESYYKVALKSVIDNFSLYAVKSCFLNKTPGLFTPDQVISLSNKQVNSIAGESDETLEERSTLIRKQTALVDTRSVLMLFDRRRSRDKSNKRKRSESEVDGKDGEDAK